MTHPDTIRPLLTAALAGSGIAVDDVAVTPAGKRPVVKVVVDRDFDDRGEVSAPVAPLTMDEIAAATRTVSAALDAEDALGEQPYTLEVSSPGVGRPLTRPRHFQRNVGHLVTLTGPALAPVTGRILRAGADGVTIEVPAGKRSPARTEEHAYAALGRAEVQVEFSRGEGT